MAAGGKRKKYILAEEDSCGFLNFAFSRCTVVIFINTVPNDLCLALGRNNHPTQPSLKYSWALRNDQGAPSLYVLVMTESVIYFHWRGLCNYELGMTSKMQS